MNTNVHKFSITSILITIIIPSFIIGGCASTSTQYKRQHIAKGEIVWAYDEGLIATKNGTSTEVADCDSLAKLISCVEDAKALVESAESNYRVSRIFEWTGLSVVLAGATWGVITTYNDRISLPYYPSTSDMPFWRLGTGELIGWGGTILGGLIMKWGSWYAVKGLSQEIDAVNMYNSNFQKVSGCRSDSTISSHNRNKNVK